jgi:succinate dehydrogenase / fumarate reductase cytochrome b subunit
MTATPNAKPARPLSPHLQIYRPQLTSGMSISHRTTGVALSFGLPVFVWWLCAVASGPREYFRFVNCMHGIVGQVMLFGWTFCFFYHFFCGVRHLLWDAGYMLTIKSVYSSGRIVIGLSILMPVAIWMKAYGFLYCGDWMQ